MHSRQPTNATLTQAQQHAYALKVQRAWLWACYDDRRRAEILERVRRMVARNPRGYLAKIAKEVYR